MESPNGNFFKILRAEKYNEWNNAGTTEMMKPEKHRRKKIEEKWTESKGPVQPH